MSGAGGVLGQAGQDQLSGPGGGRSGGNLGPSIYLACETTLEDSRCKFAVLRLCIDRILTYNNLMAVAQVCKAHSDNFYALEYWMPGEVTYHEDIDDRSNDFRQFVLDEEDNSWINLGDWVLLPRNWKRPVDSVRVEYEAMQVRPDAITFNAYEKDDSRSFETSVLSKSDLERYSSMLLDMEPDPLEQPPEPGRQRPIQLD
jgi:hypothetical protein